MRDREVSNDVRQRDALMRLRPDLLDAKSPHGIEIIQLTADPDVPSSHIYMEAQIFTPDSKRFLLHRSAHAHGSSKDDPRHQYLVCDTDNGCSLHLITHEVGATAPSISPDGTFVYYLVDETKVGGGRLTLKRVALDGSERQTIVVLDRGIPGTGVCPSKIYPLSTTSSDGKRLATAAFLGDGTTDDAPFGLLVFDLERAEVAVPLEGQTWCNLHPQYCRSTDPEASHDIMIQENHDNSHDAQGLVINLVGGLGADIHLIRDDGTDFRDLPWGRDGNEFCQGHQCWRGRSRWAITSTGTREPREAQLIEGMAAKHAGHIGIATPGGLRNDLTRRFTRPDFYHFATDIEGGRLITDAGPASEGGRIFFAHLGTPGADTATRWTYLLNPHSSWHKTAHVHPFLSPDGSTGFFNSDESGVLQAYMVRGLESL